MNFHRIAARVADTVSIRCKYCRGEGCRFCDNTGKASGTPKGTCVVERLNDKKWVVTPMNRSTGRPLHEPDQRDYSPHLSLESTLEAIKDFQEIHLMDHKVPFEQSSLWKYIPDTETTYGDGSDIGSKGPYLPKEINAYVLQQMEPDPNLSSDDPDVLKSGEEIEEFLNSCKSCN